LTTPEIKSKSEGSQLQGPLKMTTNWVCISREVSGLHHKKNRRKIMTTKPFQFFFPLSAVRPVMFKKRKNYKTYRRHKRLLEMAALTLSAILHTLQMKCIP